MAPQRPLGQLHFIGQLDEPAATALLTSHLSSLGALKDNVVMLLSSVRVGTTTVESDEMKLTLYTNQALMAVRSRGAAFKVKLIDIEAWNVVDTPGSAVVELRLKLRRRPAPWNKRTKRLLVDVDDDIVRKYKHIKLTWPWVTGGADGAGDEVGMGVGAGTGEGAGDGLGERWRAWLLGWGSKQQSVVSSIEEADGSNGRQLDRVVFATNKTYTVESLDDAGAEQAAAEADKTKRRISSRSAEAIESFVEMVKSVREKVLAGTHTVCMRCAFCKTETRMTECIGMLQFDHHHCNQTKTWAGTVDLTGLNEVRENDGEGDIDEPEAMDAGLEDEEGAEAEQGGI